MMFPLRLGIVGLWTGFLISAVGQSVFLVIYFYKLDWKKAMEEAQKRAGVISKDGFVNDNKEDNSAQVVHEETGQTSQVSSLSVKQLVVRRSFTVLLMIVILAAGVLISELLVKALHLEN
ncbi:hypothetical protein WMY93_008468 [Mugilogobius chulae]|uniref:Uncharacterized protein n=1 Tax=Mugilogobius chulae TaxID=88201 RepID=A0AAW0PQ13_9GOBI